MIFIQLAVLLFCIFIDARMSGIGLGVIGLLILMFGFGLQSADPPLEVMLIILSVVTAAAALQAAWNTWCRLPEKFCVKVRSRLPFLDH